MTEEITSAKKNGAQNFRIHTASTKVTQSELNELERAATERGIRLGEWIREVLFRELRGSDQMNSGSHINYGYRLLAEVVGMRVFLNHNGMFELIDCWTEESSGRRVFKFKLRFAGTDDHHRPTIAPPSLEDDRLIPSWVKLEVWKRDQGRCQKCGTSSGLHFDHIIPYSKGGSSKDPANIQILCGQHNLAKRDNIE